MRINRAAAGPRSGEAPGEQVTRMRDAQRALAVLVMEPCGVVLATDRVEALCYGIPGVGAVRVDADRGRIHVLYDGTAAVIERVADVVRLPGHHVRLLGGNAPV